MNLGFKVLVLFLVISVLGLGCNFFGPPEAWEKREKDYKILEKDQKEVADQIQALVFGKNECTSSNDCRVVGLGTVRCGHYTSYLVYSTIGVDEAALKALIPQFNKNANKLADTSFKAEGCGKPQKPVQCIERQCRVLE